jgi:hypothetical protein
LPSSFFKNMVLFLLFFWAKYCFCTKAVLFFFVH